MGVGTATGRALPRCQAGTNAKAKGAPSRSFLAAIARTSSNSRIVSSDISSSARSSRLYP
eukprot:scaffold13529_cov101-Isochrysis_galbana.AAC.3